MNSWKKSDYIYDITRLKPNTLYAGNAVLAILWIAGFVGIIGNIFPDSGITEALYHLSTLSHPSIFVGLWSIMIVEITIRLKTLSSKIDDVYGLARELRLYSHMMWKTLALGFGLIFGTVSLFANTISDPWSYALVMGASFAFSNICGIIADGYTRESPICDFFAKKIKLLLSKICNT